MSIKIPEIKTYKTFSSKGLKQTFTPKNFVKQMASDGFLPVIALEAFVEAGRTYQAYKRGGFDEGRERITEEFSGAVFWLGGVSALNALFEKLGQKILKLPKINVDIASDAVRKPLDSFLANEKKIDGTAITRKLMARFKFAKVISSVLIANAFIGFCLPKINQAITRSYHKNDKKKQNAQAQPKDNFIKNPSMNDLTQEKSKSVSFGGGVDLLALANNFESKRNWKLLSVDAGTCTGRVYSARNNDERVEIAFRDLSSIFFYMFNMGLVNKALNKAEQKGLPSRLDPVSADFVTEYGINYLNTKDAKKSTLEDFAKEFLGEEKDIPEAIKAKFSGGSVINLSDFNEELNKLNLSPERLQELKNTAKKMSELQPDIKGQPILTQGQVKDIFNGGHINNPEFLKEFYKNALGSKFMEKYKYVAQSRLDALKGDLTNYVKSIIEDAKTANVNEITADVLKKASKKNFKFNAINWGTGFVISAAFLSTIIPKLQYLITKIRTGQNAFPGTEQYREDSKK